MAAQSRDRNFTPETPLLFHYNLLAATSPSQMRKDIYVSFLYCSLKDENPQHDLSPKTADSWCFYQRGKQTTKSPPAIRRSRSTLFYHQSWGKSLGRIQATKICQAIISLHYGQTQNPNEHFHSRTQTNNSWTIRSGASSHWLQCWLSRRLRRIVAWIHSKQHYCLPPSTAWQETRDSPK